MSMNVPLPFRVAAGLLATGWEQLRKLPEDLPGTAVTLAGAAVRASMRVQQEIAELATRGDEVLAPLVSRPEENPPWAHFDEDDDPSEVSATGAPGAVPDYDELRIAQLRSRLRVLDAESVAELLDYEHSRLARAAFLTTLQNRLDTLRAAS